MPTETKPTFTPGPWRFDGECILTHNDGPVLCLAFITGGLDGLGAGAMLGPTSRANARLIVAAPDLYAALVALAEDYERVCGDGMTRDTQPAVLRQAREVLQRIDD